jgi:hypothetical protein
LIFSAVASSEFDVEWVELMIFGTATKYDVLVKVKNVNISLSYELFKFIQDYITVTL